MVVEIKSKVFCKISILLAILSLHSHYSSIVLRSKRVVCLFKLFLTEDYGWWGETTFPAIPLECLIFTLNV